MSKNGTFRRHLGAAMATLLALGGCAQVSESFQEARSSFTKLMGQDSAQDGAPSSEEAAGTAAQSAPHDDRYRQALAARSKGNGKEAFELFRDAAQKRHPAAAYETGRAYLDGRDVKTDKAKGTLWMDRAAAYGDARAQFYMGQAYYSGDGIKPNETKAAANFTKAASQGHAGAQYALGEAYSIGRGVPKNLPWAARWYGKSAHQGLREAQYTYGLVHARGLGLPIDRTEGYRWLLLAARAGHERAEVVRHALLTKMAPEMIQLAEVWASRFQKNREPSFADPPTVMYVQQVLNGLGYEAGPIDGQPGKRTRGAIGKFQKKSGQARDTRISRQLVERLLTEQAKAP